ncbi:MAG: alpha/beta hydrolase [Bacteroidota bacterium]
MKKILICLISMSLLCLPHTQAQKRFIDFEGAKVWINTLGIENRKEGQPLIVFESGLGTPMDNWDKVVEDAARLTPIFSYDRAGIGKSDAIEEMPTPKNVADRLIRILKQQELAPPYILIGHSMGGLYVRSFANYYPDLLAGLIIIDPADFTETHQNKRLYYEVLNWEKSKIDSLIQSFIDARKTGRQHKDISVQREGEVLEELREKEFKEVNKYPLPNIPVHILTGGRFDKPFKLRSKKYDEEALFRSKMKHRLIRWTDVIQSVDKGMLFYSGDAGHYVHYDDPELLISSIRIVLKDYQEIKDIKRE